jgi:acetyltransferase EpsM
MKKEIIILGAGGHAGVVASTAIAAGYKVLEFYSNIPKEVGTSIFNIPVKNQNEINSSKCRNAIIGIGSNDVRKKLSNELDLNWISVIHPFSWIHSDVPIGEGTVICAGSIVQPGATIGSHVIINTKSSVDHDTTVGDYSHISVAHLAGGASVGEGVMLVLHSVVLPSLHIGNWSVVGAGAVVTNNVDSHTTVVGIPARELKK